MSCATCCAGGVAARAPRHPRCRHTTGQAGSRRRFPTPTVLCGRHAAAALPGASPSTPGDPQKRHRGAPSVGLGLMSPVVPQPGTPSAGKSDPAVGHLLGTRIWVIWGAVPPATKFLTPTGMGHPVPGSPRPRDGHPAGDTRDRRPRASLPAVSDPYVTLPGGQEKTPRWHWGTRQGLPHLTPGDLWLPQLVPEGHLRPS